MAQPGGRVAPSAALADTASASTELSAEAVSLNNRAVALMGRFEPAAAAQLLASLQARYPGSAQLHINLAIATLNRQQDGDEQAALAMIDALLSKPAEVSRLSASQRLQAEYVAGLLRLYLASPSDALVHFQAVVEGDPDDPYAAYYLAQCLFQTGQVADALQAYQRAITLDPYLRSGYYGAFQALRRSGDRQQARSMLADYQRLANNPRARLAEFKYTRMGPKAAVRTLVGAGRSEPLVAPVGALFAPPREVPEMALGRVEGQSVAISRADTGGDGETLLLVSGAGSAVSPNQLYRLQPGSPPQPLADHPLNRVAGVNAALWGDVDNDGLTDVYLLRDGGNQLWRQYPAGEWHDVSDVSGTGNGDHNSVDGLMVDADHDGDLDLLVVNADGPNELFSNDLNGHFRALAEARGLQGSTVSRQALAADLDGDRDLDLVVINAQPPHQVYANDRLWQYRAASGFDAFVAAAIEAAVVADIDADGEPAIYTANAGQLSRWRPGDDGVWVPTPLANLAVLAGDAAQLSVADVDGDGVLELTVGSSRGWAVLSVPEDGPPKTLASANVNAETALRAWRLLLLDPAQGPQVLAVDADGKARLWGAGPGRWPGLQLALSGMADAGQSMRSNASGIGAAVAVRNGSRWSFMNTLSAASAPGQDFAPLVVGLGGSAAADFVSIDWSDGVYQTEIGLQPGALRRITETQRQLSSCPVLYAWDGQRYRFVSDLLGVGGIGYAIGPGEYASPRPWENFLFPAGLLQPRDGRFEIKIGEPMEETAYLDSAALTAWDLPPGWQMALDERMGINDPQPTGAARFFRDELLPTRAQDAAGEDVTAAIGQVDAQAAPVGALDARFIGRLADEQVLTLYFDQPLDPRPGEPMLVIDGWVEYPYSQTQFAAWQAGAAFQAPTLEARGDDGVWRVILPEFGYPAGMPRRLSVPLRGLPQGTRALRLRTTMEVYWDRIAVAWAEPLPQAIRRSATLQEAVLRQVGFPLRTTGPQRYPNYDYQRRSPFWDVSFQRGWYTQPGPVDALVSRYDDALALIGPGDEVHLAFSPPDGALAEGWRRYWVLETHGWAKDRDLFTRQGETVGPLPSSGRPAAPAAQLHARYNTRYQDGR